MGCVAPGGKKKTLQNFILIIRAYLREGCEKGLGVEMLMYDSYTGLSASKSHHPSLSVTM
jgi:hypothetical protein